MIERDKIHDLPDTALVTNARKLLERAAPSPLVRHSVRAFLLGAAYGRKKRIAFDEEGLALAAVFHDLGLTPEFGDPTRPFTFASSKALRLYLQDREVAAERIDVLADAIEQHMQLLPRFSHGAEVGLLQVGAWMDATGLRRWSVRSEAREIARKHPREGFDLLFPGTLLHSIGSFRACAGLLFPSSVRP